MSRELTERQKTFLQVLFDGAGGDVKQAKVLAGYSENSSTTDIVNSLRKEIMEATESYMARNAPKAAVAMVSGVDDPTQLGIRDRLSASKELLDRVGLSHRVNNLPSQLSGGEQQRVAIARAIAMKPELILADEPTGTLDTENSLMISDILFKYVKEEGSSLIMVTHDPKLANKAKRKIKIKDGKIK